MPISQFCACTFWWAGSSWHIHVTVLFVPLVTLSLFPLCLQKCIESCLLPAPPPQVQLWSFKAAWSWLPRRLPPPPYSFPSPTPFQYSVETSNSWFIPKSLPQQLTGCCLMLSPGSSYLFCHWNCRVMFSWGRSLVFLFPLSCWRGGDRGGEYKRGRRCCSRTKPTLEIQRDKSSQHSDLQESIQTGNY